jgi:transcriptional regulator with XRE-family HTH domain
MTGNDIKQLRTRYGLTQSEFAAVIGTTGNTCGRWESCAECTLPATTAPGVLRIVRALMQAPVPTADDCTRLMQALSTYGSLYALHVLLQSVFKENP